VRIVGLSRIPEEPVRAVLGITSGRAYSRRDLLDAQDALQNLGVFATVEVAQDKSNPETGEVPITVVVREASLRTLRVGGGARFDVLRLSNHFRVGWEHRNFIGGMRRFNIEARPGVTYFPTPDRSLESPTRLLPENRIHTERAAAVVHRRPNHRLRRRRLQHLPLLYRSRRRRSLNASG
jgi:outer membrane protein insertion porin family/translocation and assembly module TamA